MKKGFILSSYIYILLVFFLLVMGVMLSILNNTKLLTQKLNDNSKNSSALLDNEFNLLLLGDKDITIDLNDTFTDPGIIATSVKGDDLSNQVITTGSVNTSKNGVYQISYRLTYNGTTKEIVREVSVVDTVTSISFAEDSWDTIQEIVQSGNASTTYSVGDTKCIALDGFTTTNDNGCASGEFKVRIANMSTPSECESSGFSQTACGFVVEFVDMLSLHTINSTNTNAGGWSLSGIRTYLSEDVYDAITDVTGDIIADTTVVSGHGTISGESNFTTTDKVYLLSAHEVWNDVDNNTSAGIDYMDSGYNYTRQLDYYADNSVTISNGTAAKKQYNTNYYYWWLRTARFDYANFFLRVSYSGSWDSNAANNSCGVSPAFRIE